MRGRSARSGATTVEGARAPWVTSLRQIPTATLILAVVGALCVFGVWSTRPRGPGSLLAGVRVLPLERGLSGLG